MKAHTTAPWTVKNMPHSICDTAGIQSPYGTWIAKVHPLNGEVDQAEWMANAHLIAAAPELLEALKKCLVYVGTAAYSTEANRIFLQAEAAISKAKGE